MLVEERGNGFNCLLRCDSNRSVPERLQIMRNLDGLLCNVHGGLIRIVGTHLKCPHEEFSRGYNAADPPCDRFPLALPVHRKKGDLHVKRPTAYCPRQQRME